MVREILEFWGEAIIFILVSVAVLSVVGLLIWGVTCLFGNVENAELMAWCSSIEGTAYANGHCFKDGAELTREGLDNR